MKFIFLLLCMVSASCVTNVEQSSMRTMFSNSTVENECHDIKATGDIYELLGIIRADTKSVLILLEEKPTVELEDKVSVLAQRIDVNSSKVIKLSKSEWNEPHVRHSITWKLNDSHFSSRNLYVFNPTVKKVFFLGKERPDLIPRVKVTQKENEFNIEYLNMATFLEYCQLNETLMIVLEINHGNFRRPKSLFFNLNVNLEK